MAISQHVADMTSCVSVRLALQPCPWPMGWQREKPEMGPLVEEELQASGDKTENCCGSLIKGQMWETRRRKLIKTAWPFGHKKRGERLEISEVLSPVGS